MRCENRRRSACWGISRHGEITPPAGTFSLVSEGSDFACGVRNNGAVACWGDGVARAPPSGTFSSVSAGSDFACGVRTDGTIACWGENRFGQATPPAGPF